MLSLSLINRLIKSDSSQLLQFRTGEIIFDFEESADCIYIIVQGEVALSKKVGEENKIIDLINSGGFFGELALAENLNRKIRATAIKDEVSIISYPAIDFFKLIKADSEITQKLITTLVLRINQLETSSEIDLKIGQLNQDNESKKGNEAKKDNGMGTVYLKGHKIFNIQAPASYQNYIYSKEIECPVCGNDFQANIIRKSRLRLEEIKDNLRKIYKNFEPIWYRIRVCPECYYAAPGVKFNEISKSHKSKIKSDFKKSIDSKIDDKFNAGFSDPRNLNEVFNSYYLNIACYEFINSENEQVAASWLRLSWLYNDQGEEELSRIASKKAYQNLKEFYYKASSENLNSKSKEKLSLLLADLSIKHGYYEEALPILNKIVRKSTTKPYFKELARDKFIEIRERRKENGV